MANQCDLRGQFPLKSTIGLNDVRFVMANFLKTFDLDFDECVHKGHISIEQSEDGLQLYIGLENIWGTGGLINPPIDELCSQLGPLADRPGHLLFIDQETGNSSAVETPYFIGSDAAAIAWARLDYGFEQFEQWAAGSLSPIELDCLNILAKAMHKANQHDPAYTAAFASVLLDQAQRAVNDMEAIKPPEHQSTHCEAHH